MCIKTTVTKPIKVFFIIFIWNYLMIEHFCFLTDNTISVFVDRILNLNKLHSMKQLFRFVCVLLLLLL